MEDQGRSEASPFRSAVEYKVLFLGSCTLLLFITGAGLRAWDSTVQRESERAKTAIEQLKQDLAELEKGAIEQRFQIIQLQQGYRDLKEGHDAQSRALYNIERGRLQPERRP